MTESKVTIEQLEATLTALDELVDRHSAERVGTAFQALIMKNSAVARFFGEATMIALSEIAKSAGSMCQCEACRAQRGQA